MKMKIKSSINKTFLNEYSFLHKFHLFIRKRYQGKLENISYLIYTQITNFSHIIIKIQLKL